MAIGDLLAQITGEKPTHVAPAVTPAAAPPKRKADSDLPRGFDKVIKRDPPPSSQPRPAASQRPSNGTPSTSKPAPPKAVARVSSTTSANTSAQRSGSANPRLETANSPTPAPAPAPVKAFKKGSYQEIMARAAAAQKNAAKIGMIQHKPVMTRKEREELTGATKNLSIKGGRTGRPTSTAFKTATPPLRDGTNGSRENGKKSRTTSAEPEKKVKKAALATTGYTGTARPVGGVAPRRPALPSYGSSSRDRDRDRDRAPASSRYRYASGEEEEEDYESDASSAMEAGLDDVDEEEERALRIARKEDAIALQEENRHREEKRRRLAAMAKSRR